MSDQKAILLRELVIDQTVGANTDVLGVAFQGSRDDGTIRITIAIQSAVKVRLVPSAESGFYLNSGAALVANAVHVEDIPLDIGRTWNIQTDDVAGMVTSIVRVQELSRIT